MTSGKAKGSAFERLICKELSLFVSCGEREDLYWRSAMSGGRATVRAGKGKETASQAGDVSAIDGEGFWLIEDHVIELKHYRNIQLARSILTNTGILYSFWRKLQKEATKINKSPCLIFRQNYFPILMITEIGKPLGYRKFEPTDPIIIIPRWKAEIRYFKRDHE